MELLKVCKSMKLTAEPLLVINWYALLAAALGSIAQSVSLIFLWKGGKELELILMSLA